MSAAITEVMIGGEADKRVSLNNAVFTRRLSIGNDWNVGSFYLLLNTSVPDLPPNMAPSNLPDSFLQFGFCSSVGNVPGDETRRHAWYYYNEGSSTYNAGTTCAYYTSAANYRFARVVNGTATNISFLSAASDRWLSADGTTARTIIGVRMDKSNASQVSGGFTYRFNTVDPTDVDFEDLFTALEGTAPSGYTIGTLGFGGGPWSIDEATNGPLDSVFISSFTRVVNIEVSGAAFYRAS